METIQLVSGLLRVDEIKKPTKAKFFKYLDVGDIFTIHTYLKHIGRSSNGLYASKYTFTCEINGNIISDSMTANQAMNCLSNFVISKV